MFVKHLGNRLVQIPVLFLYEVTKHPSDNVAHKLINKEANKQKVFSIDELNVSQEMSCILAPSSGWIRLCITVRDSLLLAFQQF